LNNIIYNICAVYGERLVYYEPNYTVDQWLQQSLLDWLEVERFIQLLKFWCLLMLLCLIRAIVVHILCLFTLITCHLTVIIITSVILFSLSFCNYCLMLFNLFLYSSLINYHIFSFIVRATLLWTKSVLMLLCCLWTKIRWTLISHIIIKLFISVYLKHYTLQTSNLFLSHVIHTVQPYIYFPSTILIY
jgi:hypothetical protein